MLAEQMQKTIAEACVTVVKQVGRGVLVANQLVLTAAHCVAYTTEGPMALGDYFFEELQTSHGRVKVKPWSVEPVEDIAALGALDELEFVQEVDAFKAWCATTSPVPICLEEFPLFKPFPVFIYTHTGKWIEGHAQQCVDEAPTLQIDLPEEILGGTSGSPILTGRGELVGIVSWSNSSLPDAGCKGLAPRPHLTLPGWVMRRILAEQLP